MVMISGTELLEQFWQSAVVAMCRYKTEITLYLKPLDIDNSQFVLRQLIQHGLYGYERKSP